MVIRQTLCDGNYALIGRDGLPNPDYWVSFVHKNLVSNKVLKISKIGNFPNSFNIYSHCTNEKVNIMTKLGSVHKWRHYRYGISWPFLCHHISYGYPLTFPKLLFHSFMLCVWCHYQSKICFLRATVWLPRKCDPVCNQHFQPKHHLYSGWSIEQGSSSSFLFITEGIKQFVLHVNQSLGYLITTSALHFPLT